MARFKGAVLNCIVCGAEFKVPPSRASTAKTCSNECGYKVRRESIKRSVTLQCDRCGKAFETPRCHAGRRKFCSYKCRDASPDYMQAKSDRFRGDKNPSWLGGTPAHTDGYVYTHCPDHPFASNGYVFEHRLAMERWLRENDPKSKFLTRLGTTLYLSPAYVVHHKDEDKQNNAISNLECMTPVEHNRLHSMLRRKQKQAKMTRRPSPSSEA